MKWLKPFVSLMLIVFALVVMITSINLGIGNVQNPGPGFMGFLAAAILICLACIIFLREGLTAIREQMLGSAIDWGNLARILVLIAALAGYVLFLELLGYLLCTFLLMFIMLFLTKPKQWHRQLFWAFLITAVTYFLFNKWLQVALPAGALSMVW